MSGNPAAVVVAEKLVDAFSLVVASGVLVREARGQEQLRDYLTDAENELSDVIAALVAHTLLEVG